MLLSLLLTILILGVVLGLVLYLVDTAPFIAEPFKSVLHWLIIAVGVIYIIGLLLGQAPGFPMLTEHSRVLVP